MATGDTEHVLCDDQKAFQKQFQSVANFLRMSNFVMFETSEEMLEQIPPDPDNIKVCYCDWNLKTSKKLIHGDLIRELVRRLPNAKIIVISTSDDPKEMDIAREAGAIGWIIKTKLLPALRNCNAEYEEVTEFTVWE